jgi:hypothetical protein
MFVRLLEIQFSDLLLLEKCNVFVKQSSFENGTSSLDYSYQLPIDISLFTASNTQEVNKLGRYKCAAL